MTGKNDELMYLDHDARDAYNKALQEGEVEVYRGNIMFIGAARAGKTSTKKSLLGMKFDPEEPSTVAIDVDLSLMECELDHIKDWKKQDFEVGKSDLNDRVARLVAAGVRKAIQVRVYSSWAID